MNTEGSTNFSHKREKRKKKENNMEDFLHTLEKKVWLPHTGPAHAIMSTDLCTYIFTYSGPAVCQTSGAKL